MMSIFQFFENYADAYLCFDADRIAPFFHLPCIIIDDSGDHIFRAREDLLDYERPFLAQLRKNGLEKVNAELLSDMAFGNDGSCCAVRYRLEGQKRTMLGDFDYHYVLSGAEKTWRIRLAKLGQIHR